MRYLLPAIQAKLQDTGDLTDIVQSRNIVLIASEDIQPPRMTFPWVGVRAGTLSMDYQGSQQRVETLSPQIFIFDRVPVQFVDGLLIGDTNQDGILRIAQVIDFYLREFNMAHAQALDTYYKGPGQLIMGLPEQHTEPVPFIPQNLPIGFEIKQVTLRMAISMRYDRFRDGDETFS
jgi:hypothetical protein